MSLSSEFRFENSVKNKCTYKFYGFMIKNAFRNVSLSSEFRFENSLNIRIFGINEILFERNVKGLVY